MSWRPKFTGKLDVKWVSIDEAMPLDEHFKEYPHEKVCGIITDVFVLILDLDDLNDDPSIVMIEYLVDHKGVGSWTWGGGAPYIECHAKNIKYWAEVPSYDVHSILEAIKK